MEASVVAALTSTVTDMAGAVGTITGWWFIPIVVSIFVAGVLISLVASFFGRGKKGKKRK